MGYDFPRYRKKYLDNSGINKVKEVEMARPIKDTPILYDKDAEIFSKKIEANEAQKAPKKEFDRIMSIYNKMKDKDRTCD